MKANNQGKKRAEHRKRKRREDRKEEKRARREGEGAGHNDRKSWAHVIFEVEGWLRGCIGRNRNKIFDESCRVAQMFPLFPSVRKCSLIEIGLSIKDNCPFAGNSRQSSNGGRWERKSYEPQKEAEKERAGAPVERLNSKIAYRAELPQTWQQYSAEKSNYWLIKMGARYLLALE